MTDRHARQDFLGPDSERTLRSATVGIIGLCGGGSHVAQQLAHIGVGTIIGIDPDFVEDVNLNRMVGSEPSDAAAGRLKTDVIGDLVRRINPLVKFEGFPVKWQEATEHLNRCDCIVGCIDGFSQRNQVEAYARRFLLPYIDVGMDVASIGSSFAVSGQVILSLPGHPCMQCMGFITPELLGEEERKYGAAGPRPQVIWPNGVLASSAVGVAMSLMTPWHQGTPPLYLEYDGNSHTVAESIRAAYAKGKSCPHYPEGEVGDPLFTNVRTMIHRR